MSKFPSLVCVLATIVFATLPASSPAATLVAQWDLNGGSPATTITSQVPGGTDSADFSTATGLSWSGTAGAAPGSANYLSFQGTNAKNTLNTSVSGAALAGAGAKTFVAWIKATGGPGGIVSYSPQGGATPGADLRLLLDASGHLRGEVSGGYFVYSGTDLRNTGWKMVAVIFDGGDTSTSKFYLGGEGMLTPDMVAAKAINTSGTTVGGGVNSEINIVLGSIQASSYGFTGGIDMVKVYNGALTEAELDSLYANGTIQAPPAVTPIAQWDVNGGSPATTIASVIPSGTNSADFSTTTGLSWSGTAGAAPGSTNYLSFQGTNAHNTLNTNVSGAGLAGAGGKTFVAWIKATGGPGGIVSYSPQGGATPGADLRLLLDANGHLRGEVSGGYFVFSGTDLRNTGWKMVAAVFDGGNTSTSKFYVGGAGMLTPDTVVPKAINTAGTLGAGINSEINFVLGSIQASSYGFTGGIDMVKVYDVALTETQLDSLYATGTIQDTSPLIFIHTKVAVPGDLIILHGARFANDGATPEVWIDEVTASADMPNPETQINVVSSSDTIIHAEIPASVPEGLYAVFVKVNGLVSEPVWVNRSDAWQALDLAGFEIDPNRAFRLAGWNVDMAGAASQVFFEDTVTGVRTEATVTQGNPVRKNLLSLTAPSTLTPGQSYKLIMTNGYGGVYGETEGPTLSCIPTPADPLGLDVPWAAEYDFVTTNVYNVKTDPRLTLHAVGDGVTDDLAAIQGACDTATAAGGGCVYLPPGTYKINSTGVRLMPDQRVVLRGAGIDETTLVGGIKTKIVHSTLNTMFHNGTMDMTIKEGTLSWDSGGDGAGPVIIVRVKIDNEATTENSPGAEYGWLRGKGLNISGCDTKALVKDCVINTHDNKNKGNFNAWWTENVLIKNTTFVWSMGRIEALYARNLQIDGCTMTRRTDSDISANVNYGGWELSNVDNLALIDCLFNKSGEGDIIDEGDGETIMHQGASRYGLGYATSATSTTLTDSTINDFPEAVPPRAWYPNELVDNYNLVGKSASVVIVGGPGVGQRRRIIANTADTVTVDRPWDIIPTPESAYAVMRSDAHWLIAGNILQNCPSTIWFYNSALSDVAIVDNDFIDCADIYLRMVQSVNDINNIFKYTRGPGDGLYTSHGRRFSTFINFLIEDNEMLNQDPELGWPMQIACHGVITGISLDPEIDSTAMGNGFFDVMIRKNQMQSIRPNTTAGNSVGINGEGYFAKCTSQYPAPNPDHGEYVDNKNLVHGVVFDRDAAINIDIPFHTSTGVKQTTIWKPTLINTGTSAIVDEIIPPAAHGAVDTLYVP